MTVKQHVYGHTLIECHSEGWVRVVLPDGKSFNAVPEDNDEYRQRALDLGYPDDAGHRMNLEHDLLHAKLAYCFGLPVSPALQDTADGAPINELTGAEEAMVLATHRYLNELRKRGLWPAL